MIARVRSLTSLGAVARHDVEVVADVDEAGGRAGFEDRVERRDERERDW